jgi:hypothetical protein
MSLGYDRNPYMLAFDHRASFQKGLFGVEGTKSLAEAYEAAATAAGASR